MKPISPILLLVACISFSCGNALHKIFDSHKTPHEKYAEKLEDKDLDDTPEGRAWLAASKKALEIPQSIQLPYKQIGYFSPDKPRSLGLKFRAKQGEKLTFTLNKKLAGFVLYSDLFKATGAEAPLLSADSSSSQFNFDVEEAGEYVLRLQPELFRSGEYNLTISVGPSLGFPVSHNKANIGSFWGDNRDGGKRSHEGIDIFAPKHSPAIAAADGYITGVGEGGIGGKTVWLRPEGKNYTLYYAHLDKQLVHDGQFVKKGETIGLVGNTGNAKYTPSHLHFGVYTYAGAIDPLPFVSKIIKTAPEVPSKNLAVSLKLVKPKKINDALVKVNTILTPLAATSKAYLAETWEGKLLQVSFDEVKVIKQEKESINKLVTNPSLYSKKS